MRDARRVSPGVPLRHWGGLRSERTRSDTATDGVRRGRSTRGGRRRLGGCHEVVKRSRLHADRVALRRRRDRHPVRHRDARAHQDEAGRQRVVGHRVASDDSQRAAGVLGQLRERLLRPVAAEPRPPRRRAAWIRQPGPLRSRAGRQERLRIRDGLGQPRHQRARQLQRRPRSSSPTTRRPTRFPAAAGATSGPTAAAPSSSRPPRCSPTCPTAARRPLRRSRSGSRRATGSRLRPACGCDGGLRPGACTRGPFRCRPPGPPAASCHATAAPFPRIIGVGANCRCLLSPVVSCGCWRWCGLAASAHLALRPLPAARPARLRQLLRHQPDGQLPAGVPEPLRQRLGRPGGALRRDLVRCSCWCWRSSAPSARRRSRESMPAYLFATSTVGLAVIALHGLRGVLRAEGGVRAVPGHVRRGDRAVHRVGPFEVHAAHDHIAPARLRRPARARRAPGPAVGRDRVPRGRRVRGGVLPGRGRRCGRGPPSSRPRSR